ncbi:MAG: glycogen/starch/alpha-glucan phosphorylase [Inquilinus sp.]|nr:glycogen/starch/alpha-glucan phosphorylase [Inquilinus sp.]
MDPVQQPAELDRRGLDKEALKRAIVERLIYSIGKDKDAAKDHDWYQALALTVRDRLVDNWMNTTRGYYERDQKRVYYLSVEFLMGRLLTDAMDSLGIVAACRAALDELGVDADRVFEVEPDQALGNGGLGRLAACYLNSMASIGLAGYGYGIRYEFGMFQQGIEDGRQIEMPEQWLQFGNPWEFERPEVAYPVEFYGRVEAAGDDEGSPRFWVDTQKVLAVAYDTPVPGWGGRKVNTLRLWSAKPTNAFGLADFNRGDYMGAVAEQVLSENLSRVLYPDDAAESGQELRLRQEFFFTSASLQDILRRYRQHHGDFSGLPDKVAIQLNDTHPAIAVPELMRLLGDQHGLPWDEAWELTRRTISYTNHTLMPEALETWSVELLGRVLPRHLEIVYRINAAFLAEVSADADSDPAHVGAISLIQENGDRRVRMGNLAFLGSHRVNGVSALHSGLMKETVFADLHRRFPDRITNVTNGITPRRWLHQCNPGLSGLISGRIGDDWVGDLECIAEIRPLADDAGFRDAFATAKQANKDRLAAHIAATVGVTVDPAALFDVQIKRIHEYKRQLLNLLHTAALYAEICDDPTAGWQPRVKIVAGKAASAYVAAKRIIHLANDIAATVNRDPAVGDLLKVLFLPNYNVTLAERIIPAADLSEQISTAGMEASGTGNMKLALNGALTIGTLDGANIEIGERVGADNIFIFGLTAAEVGELWAGGGYDPRAVVEADPRLKRALDMIAGGAFSPDEPDRYRPLVDGLLNDDRFLVLADFASYMEAQQRVDAAFAERDDWMRRAVLNTAGVGWFSSDRAVREYAERIWKAMP